jgi:TRAP-type mannitol/chloroaromatic compound transport system permease small subunit
VLERAAMSRILLRLEYLLSWMTRFSGLLSGVGLVLLISLVFGNMTSRYLFSAGAVWLQELEWYLLAFTAMSGIAYAMRFDDHVRIDVFSHRLGRIPRKWLNVVTMLLVAIPSSILILYYAWPYMMLSWSRGEGSPNRGGMPWLYLPKSMILLGFILILAEAVREVVGDTRRLIFHYSYRWSSSKAM